MTDEMQALSSFIEQHYGDPVINLHPLASSWKQVYRIERNDVPDWVARIYPSVIVDGPQVQVANQVPILRLLEANDFPAERIIRATNGSLLVDYAGGSLLMTTFLGESLHAWQPAEYQPSSTVTALPIANGIDTPAHFYGIGALLGRLHTLDLHNLENIPSAEMVPKKEITWVKGYLAEVAERVTPPFQAQYESLQQALHAFHLCEDAPHSLIHNDCNPGNIVLTVMGDAALVDWDCAGCGPAILDVGILLRNCFSKTSLSVQREAVIAAVDGYCQHRRLTPMELERLPDAIGFMTLVLLAAFFSERMDGTLPDDRLLYGATYATWQAQYAATAEIATLAKTRFEYYFSLEEISQQSANK